eukprot:TRINITY_DN38843_c0_g1_i1.p1 TRINITY_DN38843_c0_g1~~TRINITY_DN38843_c0_g1_i1.p1  ORF type:complete len:570 (-),score=107.02 TRINITY_DN38843_c0_g1_i1:16-1725(-)
MWRNGQGSGMMSLIPGGSGIRGQPRQSQRSNASGISQETVQSNQTGHGSRAPETRRMRSHSPNSRPTVSERLRNLVSRHISRHPASSSSRPETPNSVSSSDGGSVRDNLMDHRPMYRRTYSRESIFSLKSARSEKKSASASGSRGDGGSSHPFSSCGDEPLEVSHDTVVLGLKSEVRSKRDHSPAVGMPFPKRPLTCKLSPHAWKVIEQLFHMMDADNSNAVTREEASAFFKGTFSKLSTTALFNEVDVDRSGAITGDEFIGFWLQVLSAGYKEKDILNEVDMLMEGAAWCNWQDSREPHLPAVKDFPKRPFFCRLSASTWDKCQELFQKMDKHNTQVITLDEAAEFFKGSFNKVSAIEMFNKVDPSNHGAVTAEEFMHFWVQVRASGYSEKDILEEVESLMAGHAWVAWEDHGSKQAWGSRQLAHFKARQLFPKRPLLCRLSRENWKKCEELFEKFDSDHTMEITREKAAQVFKCAFSQLSVEEMFKVVDLNNDGIITADEFMAFWIQVKASGYSEKDINDEIDALMEGETWINWKPNEVGHAGHVLAEPLEPCPKKSSLLHRIWRRK